MLKLDSTVDWAIATGFWCLPQGQKYPELPIPNFLKKRGFFNKSSSLNYFIYPCYILSKNQII